jgi:hypothetical protein
MAAPDAATVPSSLPPALPAPASTALTILPPAAVSEVEAAPPPPVPIQEHCVFRSGGRRSTSIDSDENRTRIRWETESCAVDIDIDGTVTFSADDAGVEAMAPGALFEIEERIGRDRRRIRMEADGAGGIERRWWVDGNEEAWSPQAERWLAAILPLMFRHTTINAEARVRRMLDEGGPERVFREVDAILSDHVARRYLEILMEEADLTVPEYTRVIEYAGRLDSDHGAAELILAVVGRAGLRPGFQDPMLRATEGIDSDHQRARVLGALLASELSAEQFDRILSVASRIDSDHQLAEILVEVARRSDLTRTGRASYLEAVRSIESDHQRAMVIHAFLDEGASTDGEILHLLEMTEGMESDHQRGEILQRIARERRLTGPQADAFLVSARGIDSDHQTAATAQAFIENGAFGDAELGMVLDLARTIASDHQRAMVLHALIRARALNADEIGALLAAVDGIGSDHQASVTLEMLVDDEELDARALVAVLRSARGIDSSHQRSTVLRAIAGRYTLEGEARALYESLADELSRRDREEALRAIGSGRSRPDAAA